MQGLLPSIFILGLLALADLGLALSRTSPPEKAAGAPPPHVSSPFIAAASIWLWLKLRGATQPQAA
jgi:hypothetical protein